MTWRPVAEDLAPHAARAMEEAYEARERRQMSRADFQDWFLAALMFLRSRSSFLPGRWDTDDDPHR